MKVRKKKQSNNSRKDSNLEFYNSNYFELVQKAISSIPRDDVYSAAIVIAHTIRQGGKIFICGNGGSFATSIHFATDLHKGATQKMGVQVDVVALGTNPSLLTAIANDLNYDEVFEKELNICSERDMLIAISCSGNSKNVLNAARALQRVNGTVLSMTGFDGGRLRELSNLNINIDSNHMGVIEDAHLSICHMIAFNLDKVN